VNVPTVTQQHLLQRVAAQAEPQRLERDHFFGRDVPEVHRRAELLHEPRLGGLRRRFEDDVCRTKLETMMRQLRPKEVIFKKVNIYYLPETIRKVDILPAKGNLSVATTRLLKSILPAACLWTSLRETEGFGYDRTLTELKALYPADADTMEDDGELLSGTVPQSIRDMVGYKGAMEALGAMIWSVYFINMKLRHS